MKHYMYLHAFWVALSCKISEIIPQREADILTGAETAAIKQRCRESYRRREHCRQPYPLHWPMHRGVWRAEVYKIAHEEAARVLREPKIIAEELALELLGEVKTETTEGFQHVCV